MASPLRVTVLSVFQSSRTVEATVTGPPGTSPAWHHRGKDRSLTSPSSASTPAEDAGDGRRREVVESVWGSEGISGGCG